MVWTAIGPLAAVLQVILQIGEAADVSATFLEKGILGAIIVALGVWTVVRERTLAKAQQAVTAALDKRTEDAKAVTDTVLKLAEDHNRVNTQFVQALDRFTSELESIRREIERVRGER